MKLLPLLSLFLMPACSFSQIDSSFIKKIKALDTADVLKYDTMAAPNDPLTQKIKLLRSERTDLTIEKIIQIKIMEEQQKDTSRKAFYQKLLTEASTGRTSTLIETYLVNLYRKTFTEAEIDDLVRFYNTAAGKKMDNSYLLLLVQSVKGAEQLLKMAAKDLEKNGKIKN